MRKRGDGAGDGAGEGDGGSLPPLEGHAGDWRTKPQTLQHSWRDGGSLTPRGSMLMTGRRSLKSFDIPTTRVPRISSPRASRTRASRNRALQHAPQP